jgi:hypothetical protein
MNYLLSPINNNYVDDPFVHVHVGVVSCAETLSADSQTLKTLFLARLIKEASCVLMACTITCKFTKVVV